MTSNLLASVIVNRLQEIFPDNVTALEDGSILVPGKFLTDIISYLQCAPGLELDYLTFITAVDYWDYFEVVYQLTSISRNHHLTVRARCPGRDHLSLPSITPLYQAADFQEREIFDLFGINFEGHPKLKRIFLWEGFQGFPLRKDYL